MLRSSSGNICVVLAYTALCVLLNKICRKYFGPKGINLRDGYNGRSVRAQDAA